MRSDVYARVYQAAFDERFSVVHLLLDGLFGYLDCAEKTKRLLDAWYAFLKEYRSRSWERSVTGRTLPDFA